MNRPNFIVTLIIAAALVTAANPACAAASGYIPGLGEFMSATQMRHAKLWFAGQAHNWALAAYEIDEIKEGFEDIIKYHPIHEGTPIPIKEILPKLTAAPLARLQAAVAAKNPVAFVAAFNSLTAACNACHQAENHGFNVITRPTSNPYTNQDFSSPHPTQPTGSEKPDMQMGSTPDGAAH